MEANWWSRLTCIKTLTSCPSNRQTVGIRCFPWSLGSIDFQNSPVENPSLVSTLPEFYSMVFSFMFTLQSPLLYVKLLANVHELLANAIFIFFFFCSCCSVTKLCLTLCSSMGCSMTGFPVLHYFLEFAETHVHWICDAIQPSHLPLPSSSPALSLSQHQDFFQWVSCSQQVVKILELQHQSFQ